MNGPRVPKGVFGQIAEQPTTRPDPGSFIEIHIINAHHHALASSMRLYLTTETYAGRIPQFATPEDIPSPKEGKLSPAVVIITIDEFTDAPQTLLALERAYESSTAIIAHLEFENETVKQRFRSRRITDVIVGYDFAALVKLVKKKAEQLFGAR